MATLCDGCKQPMDEADGSAKVLIRDAMPLFVPGMPAPVYRRPPQLDLCADCVVKMITTLELPADAFQARPQPPPPKGALSEEDLVELGIKEPSSSQRMGIAGVDGPSSLTHHRAPPLGTPIPIPPKGESLEDEIKRLQAPYQTVDRKLIK